jgi:hypothetical protein
MQVAKGVALSEVKSQPEMTSGRHPRRQLPTVHLSEVPQEVGTTDLVDVLAVETELFCGSHEEGSHVTFPHEREERDHLVTNTIATKTEVEVGRVFTPDFSESG